MSYISMRINLTSTTKETHMYLHWITILLREPMIVACVVDDLTRVHSD